MSLTQGSREKLNPVALDLKKAAERYDLDVRTFKKIVDKFRIPFINVGRKYVFPINSLDEAMKRAAEESSR